MIIRGKILSINPNKKPSCRCYLYDYFIRVWEVSKRAYDLYYNTGHVTLDNIDVLKPVEIEVKREYGFFVIVSIKNI